MFVSADLDYFTFIEKSLIVDHTFSVVRGSVRNLLQKNFIGIITVSIICYLSLEYSF